MLLPRGHRRAGGLAAASLAASVSNLEDSLRILDALHIPTATPIACAIGPRPTTSAGFRATTPSAMPVRSLTPRVGPFGSYGRVDTEGKPGADGLLLMGGGGGPAARQCRSRRPMRARPRRLRRPREAARKSPARSTKSRLCQSRKRPAKRERHRGGEVDR